MKIYKLKDLIVESVSEMNPSYMELKDVIVRERKIKYHECPHCNKEIYEKHTYIEGDFLGEHTTHHSDCGGAIKYPEPDWSKVADWLKPSHIKESDENWKLWVNSMVQNVEEEYDFVGGDIGRAYDLLKTNFRAEAPSREMFDKACKEALTVLIKSKVLR